LFLIFNRRDEPRLEHIKTYAEADDVTRKPRDFTGNGATEVQSLQQQYYGRQGQTSWQVLSISVSIVQFDYEKIHVLGISKHVAVLHLRMFDRFRLVKFR